MRGLGDVGVVAFTVSWLYTVLFYGVYTDWQSDGVIGNRCDS